MHFTKGEWLCIVLGWVAGFTTYEFVGWPWKGVLAFFIAAFVAWTLKIVFRA